MGVVTSVSGTSCVVLGVGLLPLVGGGMAGLSGAGTTCVVLGVGLLPLVGGGMAGLSGAGTTCVVLGVGLLPLVGGGMAGLSGAGTTCDEENNGSKDTLLTGLLLSVSLREISSTSSCSTSVQLFDADDGSDGETSRGVIALAVNTTAAAGLL
jgi:hypothetical protein